MSESSNNTSGGIGFVGLLTIAFIVLRLCGVIAWSWWWVLSPIWISIGVLLIVLIMIFIIALIVFALEKKK